MNLKTYEICATVNQTVNLYIHNIPDDKAYDVIAIQVCSVVAENIQEATNLFFSGDAVFESPDEYENLQLQVNLYAGGDVFVRNVLSQGDVIEISAYIKDDDSDSYGDAY